MKCKAAREIRQVKDSERKREREKERESERERKALQPTHSSNVVKSTACGRRTPTSCVTLCLLHTAHNASFSLADVCVCVCVCSF